MCQYVGLPHRDDCVCVLILRDVCAHLMSHFEFATLAFDCSVLQCAAVCCSVLQSAAVCCDTNAVRVSTLPIKANTLLHDDIKRQI